jgi:OmpA-like transmembrane domain
MQHSMRFLGVLICTLGAGIGAAHAQDYWSNRWNSQDPATAADTGLYVGAGYVRAQVNNVFGTTDYNFKIDDNAYKAIVGFRPIPPFAVEANYVNLGHQSSDLLGGYNPFGHADSRAFDIAAVGLLPLGPVDLFGKAGGARWTLTGDLQGPSSTLFALNRSGTSFLWGAGVQAHWGPLGGRLEYEHFQMPYTDGARLFSADATFTF